MKKLVVFVMLLALGGQSAFAANGQTQVSMQDLKNTLGQLTETQALKTLEEANISPAEYNRIAQRLQDAKEAGTLDQELGSIVDSVRMSPATGSYLHGVNGITFGGVVLSVIIVGTIYILFFQEGGIILI